jgi:hypothetical protein
MTAWGMSWTGGCLDGGGCDSMDWMDLGLSLLMASSSSLQLIRSLTLPSPSSLNLLCITKRFDQPIMLDILGLVVQYHMAFVDDNPI